MLDQNTDRMWYVIGAVLVGAAIILIANGMLPQMFASVTDSFENVSKEATDGLSQLSPTQLLQEDLTFHSSSLLEYEDGEWSIRIDARRDSNANWIWGDGLMVEYGSTEVPWNHRMVMSYEIYIPEGAKNFQSKDEINNSVMAEGIDLWSTNDFDNVGSREYTLNGDSRVTGSSTLLDGQWNKVGFSYINNASQNKTKATLSDRTIFGLSNHTYEPIDVKIRNVEWYVEEVN